MQHLHRTPLDQLFVIDIETVPCVDCHDSLDEMLRQLWEHKSESLRRQQGYTGRPQAPEPMPDHLSAASLFGQAGIYAEFGKVVCVSVGYFTFDKEEELWRFRVKSFAGHDEKLLLRDFAGLLAQRPHFLLCAHNGKEFDFPYLGRRLLINGLALPPQLDLAGKKPWEVPHHDTMELWKFGDRKSYTSLHLLAAIFGIPTPKDDITGADVARVYWEDDDLPRIAHYCQKDIITTARILQKFRGEEPFRDEHVIYADAAPAPCGACGSPAAAPGLSRFFPVMRPRPTGRAAGCPVPGPVRGGIARPAPRLAPIIIFRFKYPGWAFTCHGATTFLYKLYFILIFIVFLLIVCLYLKMCPIFVMSKEQNN